MKNSTKEGLLITVVALIGIVAIWNVFSPKATSLPIRNFEDARQGALSPTPLNCQPIAIAKMKGDAAAEQIVECAKQAEQHRLDTNDLIQQTRAADAAAAQVDLSVQAIWLSFIQTLAGFMTLVAACAAALYARGAAAAAKDTYELDKAVSAHVDRPWLCLNVTVCTDLKLVDQKTTTFKVDVYVENIGASPAHDVTAWIEMYRGTKIDTLDEVKSQVENVIENIRMRAKSDLRTILPKRSIAIRAPQSLEIGFRFRARAIAYVKYKLPNGEEVFSWEVFEYEYQGQDGKFVPIVDNLVAMDHNKMRARPVGLTHSE